LAEALCPANRSSAVAPTWHACDACLIVRAMLGGLVCEELPDERLAG
jgi:hypothetical protein